MDNHRLFECVKTKRKLIEKEVEINEIMKFKNDA